MDMSGESGVLVRAGAIVALLWMARAGVMKSVYQGQPPDRQPGLDEDAAAAGVEPSRLASARGSDRPRTPTISSVSPSVLPAGSASTVRISGTRLSGAFVTGSRGMRITGVQMEVDTLVLEIFVDAAATPGPATLTLLTRAGAVTVPVTIGPGHVPVIAAGETDTRGKPAARR